MHLPVQQQQHIRVLRLWPARQDIVEQQIQPPLHVRTLEVGQVFPDVLSKVLLF